MQSGHEESERLGGGGPGSGESQEEAGVEIFPHYNNNYAEQT